jgi:hypothetical protein
MPALRNYRWKISYSSDENNPVADFYIPALECAVQYDRKAGFFNSAILSKVARGLGAMLDNQGQMRLIMGCQFSPADLQAIQKGYELRTALSDRSEQSLQPPANFAQLKHFEILSWLIQNNILDIRIAIPLKSDGTPENSEAQLDPNRLFHEKVGIITDSNRDRRLAYQLEDTWVKGRSRMTPTPAKDETFLTLSRQFLTTNTPLKDLISSRSRLPIA